jgi:hypothetical protein
MQETGSIPKRQRFAVSEKLVLVAVLIIVHVIFFGIQYKQKNYFLADSFEYLDKAEYINQSISRSSDARVIYETPDELTRRPPLYPFILFLSMKLSDMPYLLILFQNLLSLASILLALKIFQNSTLDKRFVRIFLLFMILSPAQYIYSNLIMAEILLQFNLTASAFFLFRYFIHRKWHSILLFNLFISAAAFTKPIFYPFVFPVFLFQAGWFIYEKRARLIGLSLIPVMLVLIYCGYNLKRTGYFHFSSIQTKNLIDYNVYLYKAGQSGFEQASLEIDMLYALSKSKEEYGEQMKLLNKEASRYIIGNLPSYLYFHIKGSVRLFFDPGRFDLASFTGTHNNVESGFLYYLQTHTFLESIHHFLSIRPLWFLPALLLLLIINFIRTGAILVYGFWRTQPTVVMIFLYSLILFTALATGPLGASRFFVPFLPLASGMAASGILNLFTKRASYTRNS